MAPRRQALRVGTVLVTHNDVPASFLPLRLETLMTSMTFKDGDRTFTCRAETSPATPGTLWWWMSVTGESARYAAFRAEASDTEPALRPRILAYYEQLLADRARPALARPSWWQRRAAPQVNEAGEAGDNVATPSP
jgi:hypothetical protein